MQLTVLVDNNTYIDEYYLGEPAVAYYIEDEGTRILFDVGYSDICIHNAKLMHISLASLNTIVLSHGHNDHTRGLQFIFPHIQFENKVTLIAHPEALTPKTLHNVDIGTPVTPERLSKHCELQLITSPVQISPNMYFLGEIPRVNDFEAQIPIGKTWKKGEQVDDWLFDDTALAYKTKQGIYIITGCSHSGICNIIEYAKKICNDTRVLGVIGGFHLFQENEQTRKTIEYFLQNNITQLYPCHCVSFAVKACIHKAIAINEVGVGLTLNW